MDILEQAINGSTVTFSYLDYPELFVTEADLANWCILFNLTYTYNPDTNLYTVKKA